MLRNCSMELNPGDSKSIEMAAERLDPGTEVSLACIPRSHPMDMIAPAARLKRAGHYPMPHVGARQLESAAQLERLAGRLLDAGVDRILIIGGDREPPAGPYDSSLSVMQPACFKKPASLACRSGVFLKANPHIPDAVLNDAMEAKVSFARQEDLRLSIITQFCFKSEPVIEWLRVVRARHRYFHRSGPGWLADPQPATPRAVASATRFGCRARTQRSRGSWLKEGRNRLSRGWLLALADGGGRGLGIAGLHFYILGGLSKTMDSIDAERSWKKLSAHT